MSNDHIVLGPKAIEALSGLGAGFTTTLVSHPLDFIKLRMQLDTKSPTQYQAFKSICHALSQSSVTASDRLSTAKLVKNIYRGVGPNIVGSTTAWGLYFTFYREYKNAMLDFTNHTYNDSNLNSAEYLMCAFCAGWTTSLLTNPIWVIKTRMIAKSRDAPGAYRSIWDGIKNIYRYEGILGYYKGLSPALLNVAQGALQFAIYDTFKHHIILKQGEKPRDLSTFEYLYASAISKMTATVSLYPLQVIRSRLQVNSSNKTTSARSIAWKIITEEGFRGLYKGLLANLFRVVPATCITFTVYENMRQYLS